MWAGILNRVLEVYRPVVTKNDYGEEVEAYESKGSYRCGVSHQSTSRTVINSEIQYPYTKFFIVRKYADIQDFDLIKFDNTYWRVSSIEPNDDLQNKRVDVVKVESDVEIYTPTPTPTPTPEPTEDDTDSEDDNNG